MKKFLYHTFLFLIIPSVLFFFVHNIINYRLEDKSISDMENKITRLKIDTTKVNIIIAGDSRAEKQLFPSIIEKNTGYNTINIATKGGDLVSFLYAIKNRYSSSNLIFVVSVSSWQINDGAIDFGYLSNKGFQQMSFLERLRLHRDNPREFISMYFVLLSETFNDILDRPKELTDGEALAIKNDKGFRGNTGYFQLLKDSIETTKYFENHAWYKHFSNSGVRWTKFQAVLKTLSTNKSYFIMYQPPASPYWKQLTRGTFIDKAELMYSKKLVEATKKYTNMEVYDFYNNDLPELNDSMYYEYQHLNKKGAGLFSEKISTIILQHQQKGVSKK